MKGSKAARYIAISAAALLIGALGGVAVWTSLQPRVAEESSLETQPVVLEAYVSPRPVSLRPVYGAPISPRVYGSGTLRAFDCVPGVEWISGESNVTIDNRPLRNLMLPSPPWRSLQIGDRGEDVKELQEALKELGADIAPDGVFGPTTLASWRVFIGQRDANAAALEDYVWVPGGFVPSKCELGVGDTISGPVAPATSAPKIALFSVVGPVPDSTVDQTVVVGTERIPLVAGEISDPATVATLSALPIVATALATEDATIAATLELTTPIEAARISAAAIITDGEKTCVADGTTTYDVTIVDSALGRSIVTFTDDVPAEVDLVRRINRC